MGETRDLMDKNATKLQIQIRSATEVALHLLSRTRTIQDCVGSEWTDND